MTARTIIDLLTGPSARKGWFTLSDQAVVSGANFLAGIAVGRFCAKEEFGLYTLGFTVIVLAMNLQNSLIITPYAVVFPTLSGEEQKNCTAGTLVHQGVFALLAAAALLAAGGGLASFGDSSGLSSVLWALGLAIPFVLLREYSRQLDFASLHNRSALLLDLCAGTIYLSALYLLAFRGELHAARAFFLSGAACALATAGWFASHRGRFSFRNVLARADFLRNWNYARWSLAGVLANLAAIQLYPWFLTGFHGTESTGTLSACMGTVFLSNPFILGMSNFLGPRILHSHAQDGPAGIRRVVRKGIWAMTAVLGPFCLVMLLFGDRLLQFIYGSKYAGNGAAVAFLAIGQFVEVVTLPTIPAMYALGHPDKAFRSYAVALGATLAMGLPLVKYFGIPGVAAGLAAAGAAGSIYRWRAYGNLIRTPGAGVPR